MTGPNATVTTDAAAATLADLRTAERLAHDAFRLLVDALAHPGRVVQLPRPPASVAPLLLPVLALADIHTGLAVIGASTGPDQPSTEHHPVDDGLRALLHRVTGAPATRPSDADLVITMRPGELTGRLLDSVRIGSALAPELGARVIAAVDRVADTESGDPALDLEVTNRGPGASSGRTFRLAGIDPAALRTLDRRNEAYPAGLDLWLVDASGAMVGLPRTNRLEVMTGGGR